VTLHARAAKGPVFDPAPQGPAKEFRSPRPAAEQDNAPHPSPKSARGLDWFVFFVADVQTGFGPFIAVYLTTQKWTQTDIGLILSIGSIVGLIGQMPGGLIVDAARNERLVAGTALVAITASALAYALFPVFPVVLAAASLHAAASCVLGPCIVALSLGLVGYAGIGTRLGRNARFASIGNGIAAATMGAIGYYYSAQAVFFVTAALLIPTLLALGRIQPQEVNVQLAHGADSATPTPQSSAGFRSLLRQRSLFIVAGCIALFHLANAAMLPLMGGVLTTRSSTWATVMIAACIVVPQGIVALISPWVGRQAEVWGRRWFVRAAFAALVARAVLFATVTDPVVLVAVQVLDGITAACLGVMVPLMVADISRGSGHFNFAQGIVGTAVGIGASISPTLAGYLSDQFGSQVAFLGLAAIAVCGLAAVALILPETKPAEAAACSTPPQ
jgi:predicted MFS family arabinose efflux permease